MSKESLISTRDYLTQLYNSCLENDPLSNDLFIISNCKCKLNQAIKAYKEPEECIKTRLSRILDYICNTASKVYETIQWLIEDIKHYFTNDLRVDYTTGKYMYNSLAPITWKGLDRKQWDYYIIPELILPEGKKPPQQEAKEQEMFNKSYSKAPLNKSTHSFQRNNYLQQPKQHTQYKNNKMAALRARYGN